MSHNTLTHSSRCGDKGLDMHLQAVTHYLTLCDDHENAGEVACGAVETHQ